MVSGNIDSHDEVGENFSQDSNEIPYEAKSIIREALCPFIPWYLTLTNDEEKGQLREEAIATVRDRVLPQFPDVKNKDILGQFRALNMLSKRQKGKVTLHGLESRLGNTNTMVQEHIEHDSQQTPKAPFIRDILRELRIYSEHMEELTNRVVSLEGKSMSQFAPYLIISQQITVEEYLSNPFIVQLKFDKRILTWFQDWKVERSYPGNIADFVFQCVNEFFELREIPIS